LKKLFIFLNVLAVLAVVALSAAIFARSPRKPEKILKKTPNRPDILVSELFSRAHPPLTPSDLSMIVDSNLFSPTRGGGATPSTAPATPSRKARTARFDLAGICVMGGLKGAFIISSAGRKSKKQFYSVGSTIAGSEYKLLDVSPESETVVLGAGSSRLTLTLDRDDSASKKRRTLKRQVISLSGRPSSATTPSTNKKNNSKARFRPTTPDELKEKRRRILEKLKRNKR
jgi:hypothetical protein